MNINNIKEKEQVSGVYQNIDNAFNNTNAKTAMIGYLNYAHEIFIQENPDRELLEKHGFNLEEFNGGR